MIYRFGRYLFKLAVSQFFSSIKIRGAERVESGPLLVVPNHSNFLIDSLLITYAFKREFWFLAKATMFKGALLRWFLRSAHLVPVHRRQDNPDLMEKNDQTFQFAIEKLHEGRGIVIFPEGISVGQRQLLPVKTGAARIALQAEGRAEQQLNLKIQPVGITYSDFHEFRSAVTITFGEPLNAADYRERFETDPAGMVCELTAEVERRIRELTVEVTAEEHTGLVEKIAKLYQSRASTLDDRERLEIVARNVEQLAPRFPARRAELEYKLDEFLGMAADLGLDSGRPIDERASWAFAWIALPLVALGCISHFIPYQLIGPLAARFSTHPVSMGSLRLGVGLLLFISLYILVFFAGLVAGAGIWGAALLTLLILVSGYFANNYYYGVRLHVLSALWPGEKSAIAVLLMMRDELIEELETLRVL